MGLKKFIKGLVGGAGGAVVDLAGGVADIVERFKPGDVKNHQMSLEISKFIEGTYDSARKHDSPQQSGIPWIDALVNGVNRLVRPWITITGIGVLFGYWELPPPEGIAPQYWVLAKIIIGFWFGGRALFKDLPAAMKFIGKKL